MRRQGMNWITQVKRLAIYLRDDLACVYCGKGIEQEDVRLSLDHIITCHATKIKSRGKRKENNHATNLVTCCYTCNSSRGNDTIGEWAKAIEKMRHLESGKILGDIKELTRRELPRIQARKIIARRGSVAKAIAAMGKK
jgi:5-methylcytosine-specific restriction endonuclease McrA